MNELIKELWDEVEPDDKTKPPSIVITTEKELQKFAELLVEECMNATRGASTGLDAFNNIKEHFGVK